MKVHTKVVYQMTATGMVMLSDDSYDYDGDIEQAKGAAPQTQSTAPPEYLAPYLKDVAGKAQSVYNNETPEFFGGQTYVDPSRQTMMGARMLENQAFQGSPLMDQATNSLGQGIQGGYMPQQGMNTASQLSSPDAWKMNPSSYQTLNMMAQTDYIDSNKSSEFFKDSMGGKYLNQNPYIDDLAKTARTNAMQDVNAQFAKSGRTGSSYNIDAAMRAGQGAENQLRGQLYESERGRQQQSGQIYGDQLQQGRNNQLSAANALNQYGMAANQGQLGSASALSGMQQQGNELGLKAQSLAPGLANAQQQMQMQGINSMLGAGDIYNQINQDELQDAMARHQFQQNLPYSQLQQYAAIINGQAGNGGVTTTSGGGGSKFAGAAGGAASGAAMGSMFGPWGTAIGAVGGGLMGAFG